MKAQQDSAHQLKLDQASKYELVFIGWSWGPDDDVKYSRWISAGALEQTHTWSCLIEFLCPTKNPATQPWKVELNSRDVA